MTAGLFVALAVAGGLGAALRMLIDGLVRSRSSGPLPWGTIAINIAGSLLLGVAIGLADRGQLATEWVAVAGTGLLGGFTTFSTASFETVQLLRERRYWHGAANGLGTLVAAIAAAALGIWLAGAS